MWKLRVLRHLAYYMALGILPLIVLGAHLEIWNQDLAVPISFGGDAVANQVPIRAFMDGAVFESRLGAPQLWNIFLFPINSHFDFLLASGIGAITDNIGFGVNIAWFLRILLTAVLAAWCMRRLGLAPLPAALGAIIFSLSPYAMQKNLWHYNLSIEFIPVIFLLSLSTLHNTFAQFHKYERLLCYILIGVSGFNDPYAAAFSLIVLACTGLALAVSRSSWPRLKPVLIAIGVLISCAVINAIPGILALHNAGSISGALGRSPADSYAQGLNIAQLVLPHPDHPIPLLRQIWNDTMLILDGRIRGGDAVAVTLGTFGTIGLITLLLVFLGRLAKAHHSKNYFDRMLFSAAGLCIALILIASKGGFSIFSALYVTAMVRQWDRMSSFISFLSIYGAAVLLGVLLRWLYQRKWPALRFLRWCVAGLVLLAAVSEQVMVAPDAASWALARSDYYDIKGLCDVAEARLEDGASIYHFPDVKLYIDELNGKKAHRDIKLFQLRPYILTDSLRWSSVALIRSDDAESWHRALNAQPFEDRMKILLLAGFDGVWFDRLAPSITDEDVREFSRLDGASMHVSESGRYEFVDISEARQHLIARLGQGTYEQRQRDILETPIIMETGDALEMPEKHLAAHWSLDGLGGGATGISGAKLEILPEEPSDGIQIVDGVIGDAWRFDGKTTAKTTDHFIAQYFGAQDVTLSCWVKANSFAPNAMLCGWYGRDPAFKVLELRLQSSHGKKGVAFNLQNLEHLEDSNGNNNLFAVVENIDDGTWHHVVGVREFGKSLRVYVDGLPVAHTEDKGWNQSGSYPFYISGLYLYQGGIDEVSVWGRALSSSEVHTLYTQAK